MLNITDGVARVVHGSGEAEFDLAGGEFVGDVAGQPTQFGDHEGVAGVAGCQGFA